MKASAALILSLLALPAWSAEFRDYPDLPPQQAVAMAMSSNPTVLAAQAGIRLNQASQARLEAGTYEYNVRLGTARRNVDQTGRLREWDVALERPLRLPGKAAMDRELGQQGVALAATAYGDALHEAGRKLLRMWFGWAREQAQAEQWRQQAETLKEQFAIVDKRVKAGDAPRLEADLAEAAVAQAEISRQQARLRETVAANDLRHHFVGLPLPEKAAQLPPEPLEQGLDYWRELMLEHNHELALARAETRVSRLHANRTDRERTPDPTVGIRYASELGGAEQVVGLSLALPLPGRARAARSQESEAAAEIATQREAQVLRKLRAEAENEFATAKAAYESWQSAQTATGRIQRNAELVSRAYALGEMGLTDVLIARRQANEASLTATLAQLDAREARYRLMLDSHQLWPLDVDEGEDGARHGQP